MWRCHQLLSGFLAEGHLPRVSRQSRRSLMIRVIMRWSWWLCTDLLAFALPQKTSTRRPSDEGALRPVIALNGVPFLQIRSVRSHSPSAREKEANKERTRWSYFIIIIFVSYKVDRNYWQIKELSTRFDFHGIQDKLSVIRKGMGYIHSM